MTGTSMEPSGTYMPASRRRRPPRWFAVTAAAIAFIAVFGGIGMAIWFAASNANAPAAAPAAGSIRQPHAVSNPHTDADTADPAARTARAGRRPGRVRRELRRRGGRRRAHAADARRALRRAAHPRARWACVRGLVRDARRMRHPSACPRASTAPSLSSASTQEITLHAAWKTPDENAAEDARIPILMYHQFTANPEGESGWLRGNYAYIGDFDAHMNHIATTGFYLPTWDELSAFIDGRLFLPTHSVIVTDDDADQTWFDLAAPIVDKTEVLTTSFMITAYRQDPAPNAVRAAPLAHPRHAPGRRQRQGPDGQSAPPPRSPPTWRCRPQVLGVKEVMAYPFGHHNDTVQRGPAAGGFRDGPHDRARLRPHRHRQARPADGAHQLRHGARRTDQSDRLIPTSSALRSHSASTSASSSTCGFIWVVRDRSS